LEIAYTQEEIKHLEARIPMGAHCSCKNVLHLSLFIRLSEAYK